MTEKILILLTVLSVGTLYAAAPGGKESDFSAPVEINSVLASVNGEAISLSDVRAVSGQREIMLSISFSGKHLQDEIRKIRRQAVDDIINRKLVIAEYYKAPYRIENNIIEHELDQAAIRMGCRSRNDLRKKLAANNIDFAQFRKELEERMIYIYMVQKWSSIDGDPTPREIYEYYQAHSNELAGSENYELAMLKLDKSKSDFQSAFNEIDAALKNQPERFAEMVSRYTNDTRGGVIGSVEPAKLRIEFARELQNPVENKVYGPIALEDGTVWLKLLKHNKVKSVSFAQLQDRIVKILTEKRRSELIDLQINILRRNAIVKYFF